jgi:hypothetical protein
MERLAARLHPSIEILFRRGRLHIKPTGSVSGRPDAGAFNGADAGHMTVNGELHKLAHNISFGHGIHPGIHWRSDTDYSIILGEAVALKFLQDQAFTYDENIDIN